MGYQIRKIIVDGITMTGCEFTGNDQETALEGVDEATILAAPIGVTAVASPTTSPSIGSGRPGIDYTPKGRHMRCAVCGYVYPMRWMIQQRGSWVDRDCYDTVIPIRGRTGQVPARRYGGFGTF